MKKFLFIGEPELLTYFKNLEIMIIHPYQIVQGVFPSTSYNYDGIIVQAELVNHTELFQNIKMTLPYLLMYDFKVRPIILTSFLSKVYFENKYRLPFDSDTGSGKKIGVQYLRLPVDRKDWRILEEKNTTAEWTNLSEWRKIWKPFFKMVNFGSEMDHMIKRMEIEGKEDFLLFNKYRKKYQWA